MLFVRRNVSLLLRYVEFLDRGIKTYKDTTVYKIIEIYYDLATLENVFK